MLVEGQNYDFNSSENFTWKILDKMICSKQLDTRKSDTCMNIYQLLHCAFHQDSV
jgi:hypothetical protein